MIRMWYLLSLALVTSATYIKLESRNDYSKCDANGLFSCPVKSVCTPTTSDNSTVICCPDSSGCRVIQPLTCDISQQDVARFPDNLVHTTNLTASLPACGAGCCPLGYNCQSGSCVLSLIPTPPPTSTSLPPNLPSSASSSSSSSPSAAPAASETGTPQSQPQPDSRLALALGLSLGLVGALAIILLILWCLKRRRRAKASYVNGSYRSNNRSVEDFMGTTPKPPSRELDPPKTPFNRPMHERKISGPISDPELAGGTSIHRTDFILGQRGSVQTGWERKEKPFWSASSQDRPKSKIIPRSSRKSSNMDPKPPDSGRVPVFNHPLRFGLPARPKLTDSDTPDIGLSRSPTGEEKLATLKDIGGRTVPQGAVVRVDNNTPPPSRAKMMRPRDRSESQRRPLVQEGSPALQDHTGYSGAMATPERGRSPPPRARTPSDATTASFETNGTDEEKDSNGRRVTMNVMLPPDNLFKTPPQTARQSRMRDDVPLGSGGSKRQTTWDDMMKQAGSRWR